MYKACVCKCARTQAFLDPETLKRKIPTPLNSPPCPTINVKPTPRAAPGDGDAKEKAIAKTVGFVVFSGIAISILKALNPLNRTRNETRTNNQSLSESTQTIRPAPPLSPQEPITKVCNEYEALQISFPQSMYLSCLWRSAIDLFWH